MAESTETTELSPAAPAVATEAPVAVPAGREEAVLSEPAGLLRTRQPIQRGSGFHRILSFIGWVFTGFGLLPTLLRRGGKVRRQEITVYSAHKAFCLWALILVGFAGAPIVRHYDRVEARKHAGDSPAAAEVATANAQARAGNPAAANHPHVMYETRASLVLGWVYVWVLLYTFITLVFDVGTLKLLLWAGIFTFLWILARYWQALGHTPYLSHLIIYFKGLHPRLNPGLATVLSWLLLVPWVGALFLTFTNGRKKFSPNEISEWQVGVGSELTDRVGLKFRTRYRDVLEMVLGFGAGDLVAHDNHQNEIKRYENVLFLFFLWPRLDDILSERQAIVDTAPGDALVVQPGHQTPVEQ